MAPCTTTSPGSQNNLGGGGAENAHPPVANDERFKKGLEYFSQGAGRVSCYIVGGRATNEPQPGCGIVGGEASIWIFSFERNKRAFRMSD